MCATQDTDAVFGTTDGKYIPVTVALDAWQGKTVQVCLSFDAGDGQQNNFGGVHVDNFVVKLRKKIEENAGKPRHIVTIYGTGYKLVV